MINVLLLVQSSAYHGVINQNWKRHLETSGPFQSNNIAMYFLTYYTDSSNHLGSFLHIKSSQEEVLVWFFTLYFPQKSNQIARYTYFHFIITSLILITCLNVCLLTRLAFQERKHIFISLTPIWRWIYILGLYSVETRVPIGE